LGDRDWGIGKRNRRIKEQDTGFGVSPSDSPLPFPDSGMLLRGETIPDLMFGNGVQRELVRISSSLERCGVAGLKKVLK
jgi:hypothetical protein